jgi:hypothetical protein
MKPKCVLLLCWMLALALFAWPQSASESPAPPPLPKCLQVLKEEAQAGRGSHIIPGPDNNFLINGRECAGSRRDGYVCVVIAGLIGAYCFKPALPMQCPTGKICV